MKIVLLFLTSVAMGAPVLRPGEYVKSNAQGYIFFKSGQGGRLKFSIESWGANGHSCGADGELSAGKSEAKLETISAEEPCVLKFNAEGDVVSLDASEGCRYFCGARALMGGDHTLAPHNCERETITKRHTEFTTLYRKKKYDEARKTLSDLRAECGDFISESLDDLMRNDLAVTFHHLKDDTSCRSILEPLKKFAEMSDEQIKDEYLPAEAANYIATAKATRTNLKLCKAGKK